MPDHDWRRDDRERERWEREGTPPRHRLDHERHSDEYSDAAAVYQERSFQPFSRTERYREGPRFDADYPAPYGRPRVFGERETGADYRGGPRDPGGGFSQESYSPAGVGGGPDYGRQGFSRGVAPQGRYDQPSIDPAGYGQGGFGPSNFRQGERDSGAGGEHLHERGEHWWDRAAQRVERWVGAVERNWEASHRGRGPKGYTRSDERIQDDAHERLTEDPWIDASEIEVMVAAGEVTLSGTVDSRRAKHHAEHCMEAIAGVRHVQNNLRVQDHGGRDAQRGPADENPALTTQAKGKDGQDPRN